MIEKTFKVVVARGQEGPIGWWVREHWPCINFSWLWGVDMEGPPMDFETAVSEWVDDDFMGENPVCPIREQQPEPFHKVPDAVQVMHRLELEGAFDG